MRSISKSSLRNGTKSRKDLTLALLLIHLLFDEMVSVSVKKPFLRMGNSLRYAKLEKVVWKSV